MSHSGFQPFTRDSEAANVTGLINVDASVVCDQFNELATIFTALRNKLLSQADLIPLGFQLLPTDLSRAFDIPLPNSGFCPALMQPQTAGLRPGLSMDQQDLITGDSSGHTTITNLLPLSTQFAANQLLQQQQHQQQQQAMMFDQEGWTAVSGGYQITRNMGSNSAEVKSSHAGDLSADYKSQGGYSKKRSAKTQQNSDLRPNARAVKRQCLVWTDELHQLFMWAVEQLGPEKAVPKAIMNLMNVRGLTRENIASHLQKYRQLKEGGVLDKSPPVSSQCPPSSIVEGRSADGISQQGIGKNSIERQEKTISSTATDRPDRPDRSITSADKSANSQRQDQVTTSMDVDALVRRQEKADEIALDCQNVGLNLEVNEQGGSNGTNGSSGAVGGHSIANRSNGQSSFVLGPNHNCSRGTQGSNGGSNGHTIGGQHSNEHTKDTNNRFSQVIQHPAVAPSQNQDDMVQDSIGNDMLQHSNGHTNKGSNLHSNGHSGVRHNTVFLQPGHINNMVQDNNDQHSNGHSGVRHNIIPALRGQIIDHAQQNDGEMQHSNGHTKRDQSQHSNGHSGRHHVVHTLQGNQIQVPKHTSQGIVAGTKDVNMSNAKEVQNSNTDDMQQSNGHSNRQNPQHSSGFSQRLYGHNMTPLQNTSKANENVQVNTEVQNSNAPRYGRANNKCSSKNHNINRDYNVQNGQINNNNQTCNSNGHTNGHTNGGTCNSNGHTNGGTQHSNGHTQHGGDLHSNGDSGASRGNQEQVYTDMQVSNSDGGTNGGTQYTSGQSKCEKKQHGTMNNNNNNIDNDNQNGNDNDNDNDNQQIPVDLVSFNQNQNQLCAHVMDLDVAMEDDQLNNDVQNSNSYYCSGATFGSNGHTNQPPQQ